MSLGGSILILYNIHGKILVLKKYSSTMIEGGKAMMTAKGQTPFRLRLSKENRMVYLSLRPHSISHIYLEPESFSLFFCLLHTPSFSLGFLMFVSFHQSSSEAFMQRHSPPFSPCLSLSTASTLIQYSLQALDTTQLPDSDENILISYESSPNREEALRKKKKGTKEGRQSRA